MEIVGAALNSLLPEFRQLDPFVVDPGLVGAAQRPHPDGRLEVFLRPDGPHPVDVLESAFPVVG